MNKHLKRATCKPKSEEEHWQDASATRPTVPPARVTDEQPMARMRLTTTDWLRGRQERRLLTSGRSHR